MKAADVVQQFGVDLRELRTSARLGQKALAGRLGRVGAQSWVSDIERGKLPAQLSVDDVLAWVRVCAPQPSSDLARALELTWRDRHRQAMLARSLHVLPPADAAQTEALLGPDTRTPGPTQIAIVNGGESYMVAGGNIIIHGAGT